MYIHFNVLYTKIIFVIIYIYLRFSFGINFDGFFFIFISKL